MDEKLLKEFSAKEGVKEDFIAEVESSLQWSLPKDYKEFIEKTNGGEGFIGENYLILCPVHPEIKTEIMAQSCFLLSDMR